MRKLTLLPSAVLAAALLLLGGRTLLALLALPVCAALLILFGRTLRPGQVALITQLATRFHGALSPQAQRYTRWVTWVWTAFFAAVLLEIGLLAAFAPERLALAGLCNLIAAIALFIGEFWLRRAFVRDMPHAPFRDYMQFLRRHGLRAHPAEAERS